MPKILTRDDVLINLCLEDLLHVASYPLYYNEGNPYFITRGSYLDKNIYKVNLKDFVANKLGITFTKYIGDNYNFSRCYFVGNSHKKIRGISLDKKRSKWVVQKMINGQRFYYRFDTIVDALNCLEKLANGCYSDLDIS